MTSPINVLFEFECLQKFVFLLGYPEVCDHPVEIPDRGFQKGSNKRSAITGICGKPIILSTDRSYGLATKISVSCGTAGHKSVDQWTSQRTSSGITEPNVIPAPDDPPETAYNSYNNNKRLVLAGIYGDMRLEKLTEFTAILGLTCVGDSSYAKIRKGIEDVLDKVSMICVKKQNID
jgi:hypothetical protein